MKELLIIAVGLAALNQRIAHGAVFDSAERYPPGKCHPGTRARAIAEILSWIDDPTPSESVLWIHGSMGVGKSAVMQSIAEILFAEKKNQYGGSFFFSRGVEGRDNGNLLFATLAYQLAVHNPSLGTHIDKAMTRDPSLPTKSMDVQLRDLIIRPMHECWTESVTILGPVILIDGLDECHDSDSQCTVLALVAESIGTPHIPLRFLIASRPEYWIRDCFVGLPLSSSTRKISLNNPESGTNDDIEKYLTDKFDDIYVRNSRFMGNVKRPWPSTEVIDRLVRDASGQFVYASTVLKFIGKAFCDPRKQLDIILSPGPFRSIAFSELDKLYTIILSQFPRPESLRSVLGGLLLSMSPAAMEFYLGVDPTEVAIVLDFLSSLVTDDRLDWPKDDDELTQLYGAESHISFSHLSFREFLQDHSRAGPYFSDQAAICDQVAISYLRFVDMGLSQKECSNDCHW
ncbi:hypothetical protein CVT25_002784 [Psilocybe cyanescens]|uniref:Nephrocystin 3-like N-terminal domain-containing protein n=1 Tax=Psilocybe cyanescens TaxID=93625 RepID=A0A409VYM0_PSICY|nr:hypothetical protein CVT25_002784 [Psilocybe cyanescens]